MVEKTAAAGAKAEGNTTFLTSLKVGVFLLVMLRLAGAAYGAFWGLFVSKSLEDMLGVWRVADYATALNQLFGLSLTPLPFAILFVLAPLVGWWIYSRIAPPQQNAVGWSAAAIYCAADSILSLLTGGFSIISLIIGSVIVLLYTMFCMGIGFNIAKLFKLKL